ncbi:MAG: class I SAM-dependent methyltransferase [Promethearchaeota archaeon]
MGDFFKDINKKKRIIRKYNSTAYFYDKRYATIQEMKYEIAIKEFKLNRKRILDMGCGTGLLYEYLVNSTKNYEVSKYIYIGIDISWNMLLTFKSKMSQMGHLNPILILCDIENLPIRNKTLDSVFSLTSFQNLPYIEKGIEEMLRVSKKDAELKLSVLKKICDLVKLQTLFKSVIKNSKIINIESLEDYIILGKK